MTSPQIILAVISILKELIKFLGAKNKEYKAEMSKAERQEMLKRDVLAIKRAFKEKDEKALNLVFSNDIGLRK